MEIPNDYSGFRAGIGAEVPSDHFVAKAVTRQPDFARWLDERYERVFSSGRFEAADARLARLRHDLARPDGFMAADAEVQSAATLLLTDGLRVVAPEELARSSDYVAVFDREIDVEVRVVQENQRDQEADRVSKSIEARLRRAVTAPELMISIQVRRTRVGNRLVVDGRAEKALAREVTRAVAGGDWRSQPVGVTVRPDGVAERVTRRTGRSQELAYVELRHNAKFPRPWFTGFGGLQVPPEEERVYRALKKKGDRKQRRGDRPWVVVLDTTDSMLLELEEIKRAVERRFADTQGSLAAVAVQRWSLSTPGWGVSADDQWTAGYYSVAFRNQSARHPLTEAELAMFMASSRVEIPASK